MVNTEVYKNNLGTEMFVKVEIKAAPPKNWFV